MQIAIQAPRSRASKVPVKKGSKPARAKTDWQIIRELGDYIASLELPNHHTINPDLTIYTYESEISQPNAFVSIDYKGTELNIYENSADFATAKLDAETSIADLAKYFGNLTAAGYARQIKSVLQPIEAKIKKQAARLKAERIKKLKKEIAGLQNSANDIG